MKILYFGGGYVGSCSAAVSADSGHQVVVYDINSELVKKLSSGDKDTIESYLFEERLGELIIRNKARIKFTDQLADVKSFVDQAEAVFLCLPTPERDETGETNLSYYQAAAQTLAEILASRNNGQQTQYILIINKSTVPVGTAELAAEIMKEAGVKNFGIGSNPEFLVEGKAVAGSIRPQRIVVGALQDKDFTILKKIYNRFVEAPNVEYIEVNPTEAETGKLLANFLLFSRLANCFDVAGRICEQYDDIQFENIRRIVISDKRIGDWGFYNSLFAGGSCLIKDARSLSYQIKKQGAAADIVDGVLAANERQLNNFLARADKEAHFSWQGKKAAILGLAFKRDSNDTRNAASLKVTEFLLKAGVAEIKAFDPVAGANFLNCFSAHQDKQKIALVNSEAEAMAKADVLLIAADWPQFRELYNDIIGNLPKGALIMDGRRLLHRYYSELSAAGYDIIAVGSSFIKSKK